MGAQAFLRDVMARICSRLAAPLSHLLRVLDANFAVAAACGVALILLPLGRYLSLTGMACLYGLVVRRMWTTCALQRSVQTVCRSAQHGEKLHNRGASIERGEVRQRATA